MRVRSLVLALMISTPAFARAQATDTTVAQPRRNVFAIHPWSSNAPGPRLELERAVSKRVSLVAASRLTVKQGYVGGKPLFPELGLGVRYYAGEQAFHGAFVGLDAGYERVVRGYFSDNPRAVPRAFVGATAGYDFVVFRRLIIAPALGFRYGRFAPVTDVHTWDLSPRIGFGLNFD